MGNAISTHQRESLQGYFKAYYAPDAENWLDSGGEINSILAFVPVHAENNVIMWRCLVWAGVVENETNGVKGLRIYSPRHLGVLVDHVSPRYHAFVARDRICELLDRYNVRARASALWHRRHSYEMP